MLPCGGILAFLLSFISGGIAARRNGTATGRVHIPIPDKVSHENPIQPLQSKAMCDMLKMVNYLTIKK